MDPLVRDAVAGDRGAAQALLSRALPRVRNLVRYLVRGDDIDDIAQEALLAIVRGLPSFRGDGSFDAWSGRIVARVTLEATRKRRLEDARESAVDGASIAPTMPDDYLARRRAVLALDQLSYDLRHTLVLHHVLELSVPEIARELRIPHETVRSRLRLGRAKLRLELTEEDARAS